MKKALILFLAIFTISWNCYGQQDPMLTQYMFNTLSYNPAYAGSKEYMSFNILHRDQWLGFNDNEGKPITQVFTMHTPIREKRVGFGISASMDQLGPTKQVGVHAQYAYRIPVGKGKLALGLQGGVYNWRADFTKLTLQNTNDPAFTGDENGVRSLWLPNFGAGLYFHTKSFYFGASVPHILDPDLRRDNIDPSSENLFARQYRHYYAMGGVVIRLSDAVHFRPSFLVKNVGLFGEFRESGLGVSAPTEFDIDASLLFHEKFWIGTSFRSAFEGFSDESSYDSVDLWIQIMMKNGLRIGAAYDFPLSKIVDTTSGSYEVMIGFDLDYSKDKIVTPRYF